jgi:hypothetical protein
VPHHCRYHTTNDFLAKDYQGCDNCKTLQKVYETFPPISQKYSCKQHRGPAVPVTFDEGTHLVVVMWCLASAVLSNSHDRCMAGRVYVTLTTGVGRVYGRKSNVLTFPKPPYQRNDVTHQRPGAKGRSLTFLRPLSPLLFIPTSPTQARRRTFINVKSHRPRAMRQRRGSFTCLSTTTNGL